MSKTKKLLVATPVIFSIALGACAGGKFSGSRSPSSATSIDPAKVKVLGGDETSFQQQPDPRAPLILDSESYDVIVVGAGLSGLAATTFLTDPKYSRKVLTLEKEDHVGGLASGGVIGGNGYSRGAAYWTDPFKEEMKILRHIGLGHYQKDLPIPEPIDSYWVRGKLYRGIWAPATVKALPASFELFHQELVKENAEKLIPDQPFEDFEKVGGKMDLDRFSASEWIREMPETLRLRKDEASKRITARFNSEIASGRLNREDPMIDVVELMDLYCRSALGENSDKVSAMAFANFYISEIITRYTSDVGTSIATQKMTQILAGRADVATIKTSSPVVKIVNQPDHVEVQYLEQGKLHQVNAQYVVFSSQLKEAPALIEGFAAQAPEQAGLMSSLGYSHYSVHGVEIKGHPYTKKGAYDTWMHAKDYSMADPSDFILGRWIETHGFKTVPTDDTDILTIYHPLPQSAIGHYSVDDAAKLAAAATDRVLDEAQPLFDPAFSADPDWKNKNVISVTTNMWPFSIHIAEPGHYINKAKILRKNFQRVFFASNNLGTPAFEEALFRGHCGANNALNRLVPGFKQETWSRCHLEE
jgi:phytoene dehydrogenase-like protein